tara:strand:+ start:235 stop:2346 length:2112 start_codon:yes stop_codon:yes gene_type:complete
MATYFRMFDAGEQWLDASGDPYSGGKLYLDDAGTSTNRTSYKDNAGAVAHTNPIVLDSAGRIASGNNAWVLAGDVKVILHDSADVLIFTQDDYVAQGDTSVAGDGEWVGSDLVPTRTANTIFTLPGDNTAIFHVGRRLKLVDSTTVYATITVSAYTTLTTLTVVVDGGTALTASLASLSYSLLNADNTSDPGRPRNLTMVNDGAVIKFGVNSDVTLTHVHDTGLLLNSTMALQFNDASQYINAPTATVLDINATDEVEINATLADVNANLDVSGTYQGGGTMTTGGNIVVPDAGTIGSASDTDAIAISSAGVVALSATTEASAIGTAALTVAGGIGVTKDMWIGDDIVLDSDAAVIKFGADQEVTLTHVHNTGLNLSSGGTTITELAVTSTNSGSAEGPTLTLYRDSANAAVNDVLGQVLFKGTNDADEDVTYASITTTLLLDETDGTEDGQLDINVMRAGSLVSAIALKENEIELNAADIDINGDVTLSSSYTLNLSNIGTEVLYKAAGLISMGRDSSGTYAETEGKGYYSYYNASDYTRVLTYTTSGGSPVWQSRSGGGTLKSEIEANGDYQSATNSYGATSDERLKEHITDSGSQWDDIKAMRVRKYSFITDETDGPTQLGVIAQELEASGMTSLVKTKPYMDPPADGEGPDVPVLDADGNPTDYKTVKYSVLYMKAVKALQEAMERIETLEARVLALET